MTTNYEKIKNMSIDEIVELLIVCINLYGEVADFEYRSPVLSDIYYDEGLCKEETKQWLQQESEG